MSLTLDSRGGQCGCVMHSCAGRAGTLPAANHNCNWCPACRRRRGPPGCTKSSSAPRACGPTAANPMASGGTGMCTSSEQCGTLCTQLFVGTPALGVCIMKNRRQGTCCLAAQPCRWEWLEEVLARIAALNGNVTAWRQLAVEDYILHVG